MDSGWQDTPKSADNPAGYFQLSSHSLYVAPGRNSYFRSEPAEISFSCWPHLGHRCPDAQDERSPV